MKIKSIKLDLDELDKRLNYWLDKVEECYKNEVRGSMDNFRREIGIDNKDYMG